MGLTSFNFSAGRGHLQLRFSNGQGRELRGSEVMPLVAFASDLLAEVARRKRGRIDGLRVDLGQGVLKAMVDGKEGLEEVYIAGPEFETLIRANSCSLIRWAESQYIGRAERC